MSHADHSHDHTHTTNEGWAEISNRLMVEFFSQVAPWALVFLGIIHFAINFLAVKIGVSTEDFSQALWGIKLIFLVLAYYGLASNNRLYIVVEPNEIRVFQGFFTGWRYPKYPGFNWISPFSTEKFNISTNRHLEVLLEENAPVAGGKDTMPYKARVLFRVDKSYEGVLKYTETTESNIKAALLLRTSVIVTTWLYERETPDEAKANRSQCFQEWSFEKECALYGLIVETAEIQDLDYSETVQKAKAASSEFTAMIQSIKELEAAGVPTEDAVRIAKAKYLGGNYKQIDVTGGTAPNIMVNPNQ